MLSLILWAAALGQPVFAPRPCTGPNAADPRIVCGTVRVAENRAKPDGRAIDLAVVILKATSATPDLPPLVDIDGGPGFASTRSAAFYRTDGIDYRARRDVILVDQRGTGGSNPLICPDLATPQAALRPLYPPDAVAACRKALESHADLARYHSDAAAADLDAVRAALGHERIDIVAISYGTTLALRYMAGFPGRVRAAVLSGMVPADAMPPQHHAVVAQAALARNFADCAAEPACAAAFPDLAGDLRRAIVALNAGPDPVSAPLFMEKLRSLLYAPATARSVPLIVHRAAQGELEPLLATAGAAGADFADGAYLSITCAESMALMDVPRARAAAARTLFGDYRLARQQAACAVWPRAGVARDFLKPVRSSAQILLISGGRDPVTPAAWAERAAHSLPNARLLTIPASGHSFDGLSAIDSCYDPLLIRFFATGAARALDTACLAKMKPPPFQTGGE